MTSRGWRRPGRRAGYTPAGLELHLILATVHEALLVLDPRELHARYGVAPEESAAGARLELPAARAEHLSARALVRSVLAERLGVGPGQLDFVAGRHGRPRLAAPWDYAGVDFNLAHSDGLIACLVGPADALLGVDVERTTRPRDLAVARDFFAPAEVEGLFALPPAARQRRFYQLWTLKEAYIKARGLGLALPLDSFHFAFEGPRPRLTVERSAPALPDGSADVGAAWSFQHLDEGEHLIAIGACPEPRALEVRRFAWPRDVF